MDRERIDAWCERGILALVLGILVFGPLATGAVRTLEFLVIQALTIGVILLWAIRLWLRPRPQFLMPPMGWAVVAFAIYAVVRYCLADIEYVARLESIRVLIYTFLFFAIVNNLHRQESVNLIGYTLVFLAMGISFYAAYQFFSGNDHVWHFSNEHYRGRGTGTYVNPNHLAGFLEMILPLAIAYTLVGRVKPVLRILLGYCMLVIGLGICVSLSRGGWLASSLAFVGFFFVLLFHRGYRLVAAITLVSLLVLGGFVVPKFAVVQERAKRTMSEAATKEFSRYLLWLPTIKLWEQEKVIGIGPGHYDYRFRSVRPQEVQLRPDRAHNDYLNTLVDWGLVGFVLVSTALGLMAWGIRRTWRYVRGSAPDLGSRGSNRFAFVLGATFGLFALMIHSLVDFNMQIPANAILAVTLMALLSTHIRFSTERFWFNAPPLVRVLVTIVLLAGLTVLAYTGTRSGKQYLALERASALPAYSPEKTAALEKAFAAEPHNFETAYEIGECFRVQSWEGGDDYAELAQTAIKWFSKAEALNPYDGYSLLRKGMCLDWLGRYEEAAPYFSRAEDLDPNGYFTVAHVGWHYVQMGQFAAARPWFERSLRLHRKNNPIAETYLELCHRRLLEAANEDELTRVLRSQSVE